MQRQHNNFHCMIFLFLLHQSLLQSSLTLLHQSHQSSLLLLKRARPQPQLLMQQLGQTHWKARDCNRLQAAQVATTTGILDSA